MIQLKIKNDELEKIEPRTLCEEAWQEIASHFPDFKVLSKGQKLKRVAKDKDICFEIYFQANRYNNKDSVEFIPHIGIYSKSIKRAGINNGFIYGGDLGSLSSRKPHAWWQLAGASYKYTVEEVSELIKIHIIPIFDYFEDTQANIDRIISGSCMSDSLLYYIFYFGGKNKAQQYFNRILKVNIFKNKYISFYESLKSMPEENIDLNYSEFSGAIMIKFAYLNGIEIKK